MAGLNPAVLRGLVAALMSKSVASLPDPTELGLSPALPGRLAAYAAAGGGNGISARALAALPAEGGGSGPSRLGDRLTRTRDLVFGEAPLGGGSAPVTLQAASATAASEAASTAKAQGAAIEAAVRARLALGPADAAAVTAVIESVVPVNARTPSERATSIAAVTQAPVPPADDHNRRWYAASGRLPDTASGERRESSAAPATADLPAEAQRWQSWRVNPTTPAPPLATAPAVSQALPEAASIALPPCDGAALSSLASTASLFRAGFGRSLAAPGATSTLVATMEGFNQAIADVPTLPPATLAVLAAWGSLARGVGAVREQMGVDLVRRGAGRALAVALAGANPQASAAPLVWQEDRAKSVARWLSLDQAASALDMPTSGPGAMRRLGLCLRGLAALPVPPCQNPVGAAALMSAADNVRTVTRTLGVNPLAQDGGERLRAIGQRLRDNLAGLDATPDFVPSTAGGLTPAALACFAGIDRAQAGDLRLDGVRADSGAVMTSAPLVLATIAAIGGPTSD